MACRPRDQTWQGSDSDSAGLDVVLGGLRLGLARLEGLRLESGELGLELGRRRNVNGSGLKRLGSLARARAGRSRRSRWRAASSNRSAARHGQLSRSPGPSERQAASLAHNAGCALDSDARSVTLCVAGVTGAGVGVCSILSFTRVTGSWPYLHTCNPE